MIPRPRELLATGSDVERARARKAVSARVHSGWSEDRALDTPIGAKPGPVAGYRHARSAFRESVAGVSIDATTPYADDVEAQRLVEANPDGMTLEQVGDVLGVTRERVRQIEAGALKSLRLRCALAGIEPEDVAAMLAGKRESAPRGAVTSSGRPIAAPRSVGEEPLPPAAWSEHGQRVEAALRELEDVAERLRRRCA